MGDLTKPARDSHKAPCETMGSKESSDEPHPRGETSTSDPDDVDKNTVDIKLSPSNSKDSNKSMGEHDPSEEG